MDFQNIYFKQTTLQLYMLEHIDSHREIYMLKSKTKPVNLTYIKTISFEVTVSLTANNMDGWI